MIKLVLCILTIPVSGILWSFGGHENTNKNWRRVGVPLLLFTTMYLVSSQWMYPLISMTALWASSTLGYGIPDKAWQKSSPIGTFWYNISDTHAHVLTRLTVSLCYGSAVSLFSFLNGHWIIGTLQIGVLMFLVNRVTDEELHLNPVGWGSFNLNAEEYGVGVCVALVCLVGLIS